MLLELGCQVNNSVIKQRHLRDDKDKRQFSLNESIYIITYSLKKITHRQRRYTYELRDKELLNQWLTLVGICLLCQDRFFKKIYDKNQKKNLFVFSNNSFYLQTAATDYVFACPLNFKICTTLALHLLLKQHFKISF